MADDEEQQDFFSSQPDTVKEQQQEPQALFFGDDDDADEVEEVKVHSSNSKRINSSGHTEEHRKRLRRESSEASGSSNVSRQGPIRASSPAEGVWDKRLIGTFIVQAWSLSKGSNYVQQGDKVQIQRQKPKVATGQVISANAGKGGKVGKKQTTLAFGAGA
jgi:DNA repair protein RAD5